MKTKKYTEYPQFPDEREKGKDVLEQVHLVQVRMLKIFDTICKKHNIDYWLDYGTLLGAIRHEGFIPWDTDIDIGMLRPDYETFSEIGFKDLPADIFFQNCDTDPKAKLWTHVIEARLRDRYSNWISVQENPIYKTVDWHNGLQIDIFVYDRDPIIENSISSSYERVLSNSRIHLKFDEIEYLDTAIFEKCEFPIPVGYDSYLRRCYGNYMELPPKEEQEKIPRVDVFNPCDHPESLNFREK